MLVEFAGYEHSAREHDRFVELIDDRRLADPGITGYEDQDRFARCYNLIERVQQHLVFPIAAVQFFGHQEPV